MLFIHISVIILYFDLCAPKRVPGIPRRHVRVLDNIISKYIDSRTVYQNSTVDLILSGTVDNTDSILDNQDINILDHKALKNIIEVTKNRISNERLLSNSRKYFHETDLVKALGNNKFTHETEYIIDKAFEMMKQSIYATRYRLNDTNAIRRMYKTDPAYNMAILIGNIHQTVMKCDNIIGQMKKLPNKTHFLHPLLMYERILAGNIDITYLTQRVFLYDKIAQSMIKGANEEEQEKLIKPKGFTKLYGPPKDDNKNKPPKPQGGVRPFLDEPLPGSPHSNFDPFKNNTK